MSEEISLVCNSLFVSPRPTERGPIIAEMRALAVTCIHQYPLRVPAGEFLDLPTKYCTVHMYSRYCSHTVQYSAGHFQCRRNHRRKNYRKPVLAGRYPTFGLIRRQNFPLLVQHPYSTLEIGPAVLYMTADLISCGFLYSRRLPSFGPRFPLRNQSS